MSEKDEFRLRPPRHKRPQSSNEPRIWSSAFKRIIHIVRMSRRGKQRNRGRTGAPRPFRQRCAVRLTYSPNKTRGQWQAHGRYIARETAAREVSKEAAGFGPAGAVGDLPRALARWQAAGDPRVFKIIISPEFGERIDMVTLVRSLMARMERDLETPLEWVAAVHTNTEHPHAHVALRGVRGDGQELRLPSAYVKEQVRAHAEDLCTCQLGYRTQLDTADALAREVTQFRYTSLDRVLTRASRDHPSDTGRAGYFVFELGNAGGGSRAGTSGTCLAKRLRFLATLGLAEPASDGQWQIRQDFASALKAYQESNDRQRTLAAHGAMISDPRLPFKVTDLRDVRELYGRVLVHGEEEMTGRAYMLLEGTDASVHYILQDAQLQTARHQGQLRPGSFICLRRGGSRVRLAIEDLGDAEALLANGRKLEALARTPLTRNWGTGNAGWGGWLGRFQAAIADAQRDVADASRPERGDHIQRGRDRK
jgi:Protein of unknown function (DUF3363)